MKKLLYIPLTAQSPGGAQEDDLFKAFKKEYDAALFSCPASTVDFKPDIIHVHSGAVKPEVLKSIKEGIPDVEISTWTGDASYAPLRRILLNVMS